MDIELLQLNYTTYFSCNVDKALNDTLSNKSSEKGRGGLVKTDTPNLENQNKQFQASLTFSPYEREVLNRLDLLIEEVQTIVRCVSKNIE